MNVIIPKDHVLHRDIAPRILFFLAGPIRGGGDWQHAMCNTIAKKVPASIVATPTRWGEAHPLYGRRMQGSEPDFVRQLDWERHYLELAGHEAPKGAIIFWLGAQKEPREDGGPYARDTLGELGEWRGRLHDKPKLRVVIGGDESFSGLDVIKRNFDHVTRSDFPIYNTMDETVDAAIRKAVQR